MQEESFDLVVIGGGPAGSAAAYTGATSGLATCVIDKKTFPREKLCGGLITPRSRTLFERTFGRVWNHDLFLASDEVSFYSDGRYLASLNGYSTLFFTMRFDFDAYLLSIAEGAGAQLITGDEVRQMDPSDNTVTLAGGRRIRYGVLIGADGVNSGVAKSLFGSSFDQETIGFGLEVEVPRDALPKQPNTVEIDFGAARWGYGWIFPKQRTFTIGVGGLHKENPDLRERFASYLKSKGLDIADFRVKGQYIPFGDYRKVPGNGNILLAGDAAGVVDPITGEGIAFAMQTGQAAAAAAVSAMQRRTPNAALGLYLPDYKRAVTAIRQARKWRYLIFPPIVRRPFAWAFKDAGTLQRGYLDILAGKHEYNALYRLFVWQVAKAVRKLTLRALGRSVP
jgi:menaquinone-9 beta-reductase